MVFDEAQALGLTRLGLLGTEFTMRAWFYPETFARAGIELVAPNEPERTLIHEKYVHELLKNQFRLETRTALLGIKRMRKEDRIEATLPAGTELPLLLAVPSQGLPFSIRL